jgi:hypothetical protein
MNIGNKYLVKCGWGDTVATLEYVAGNVHYFQDSTGFKFLTNGLEDVYPV